MSIRSSYKVLESRLADLEKRVEALESGGPAPKPARKPRPKKAKAAS